MPLWIYLGATITEIEVSALPAMTYLQDATR